MPGRLEQQLATMRRPMPPHGYGASPRTVSVALYNG